MINNELKNFICEKHNDVFISYCKQCKKNLCMKCVNQHKSNKNHKNHDIIHYFEILPEKTNLKKKLKNFKNEINIYKEYIQDIINKLNDVKDKIEILYNIYNDMINNFDDKYRNYEIFASLNSIDNNSIIDDLKILMKSNL